MYAYIHIYIYAYIHIYMYTCVHVYIYTYIHVYIYTYTHMHIHIHRSHAREARSNPGKKLFFFFFPKLQVIESRWRAATPGRRTSPYASRRVEDEYGPPITGRCGRFSRKTPQSRAAVPISPRGVSVRSGSSQSRRAACHFGRPRARVRARRVRWRGRRGLVVVLDDSTRRIPKPRAESQQIAAW